MIYYLLLTAFTVSIDSFICGFSLSFLSKRKLPIVLGIALIVLIMCTITNYLTIFFANFINQKTASLGGLILILLGIFNAVKKDNTPNDLIKNKGILSQIILIGFAVGLDGSLANLSLSLMGTNAFYVPLTIALTHAIMIWLGTILSQTKLAKKLEKIEFISPLILMLLGGYKLLGLFI